VAERAERSVERLLLERLLLLVDWELLLLLE
jgi:hypothetical protein